jgi:hypothetical protein
LILFPALAPNFLADIIDPQKPRVEGGLTKFFQAFIA